MELQVKHRNCGVGLAECEGQLAECGPERGEPEALGLRSKRQAGDSDSRTVGRYDLRLMELADDLNCLGRDRDFAGRFPNPQRHKGRLLFRCNRAMLATGSRSR